MYKINKKDIIKMNQEIGEKGIFANESSLDFALSIIKKQKSWLYELSYLLRSILIDHVFHDGNKRTALGLTFLYFDYHNIAPDKEKLVKILLNISKKNISNINRIMRLLKNGIR